MQKVLDNKSLGLIGDTLKEDIRSNSKLTIMSAYFSIYAFQELKKQLLKVDSVKLLFTEPTFTNTNEKSEMQMFREKGIAGFEDEAKFRNQLNQHKIAKECAEWLRDKVEVKSMKHSSPMSMINILNPRHNDVNLFGSTHFTSGYLGFTYSNVPTAANYTNDNVATEQYVNLFESHWSDPVHLEEVKESLLEHLEVLHKDHSPEFIYFVTLYHIFKDYLDELDEEAIVKSKTGFQDTSIWNKLYKFQRDGVLGAIDKLEKYNGCIIADSVGLGKTFEALAVIKYYELRNDRVLVLSPKKLRENWTIYTQNDKRNLLADDRFNYDVLNHTDLSRYQGMSADINLETVNWSNYDLIVIDESHNFRNNEARKDRETRYQRLMNKVIKSGVKTKVLMLSATPLNNRMNDLKNQMAFITEGKDDALENAGISSVESSLRKAQVAFNKWLKLGDEERNTDKLLEMLNTDYFKLLDSLTIARSRKHLEKYYDLKKIGKFPKRLKPINIYPPIDNKNEFPSMEQVNKIINRLNLSAYAPLRYLLPEKRAEYSKKYDTVVKGSTILTQADRENSLIHLMRVNLLKRMESSIHSFGLTVSKLLQSIDNLLDKLEHYKDYSAQSMSISDIDLEDDAFEDMLIGAKVKVLIQDLDRIKWKQALEDDKENLEEILREAFKVQPDRDEKLQKLKTLIQDKVNNPINNNNKKVIVFTAFADTAKYLYDNIADWSNSNLDVHSAIVTGSGQNKSNMKGVRAKDINGVLTHFSPNSKNRDTLYPDMKDEIDILIATDCISEGQNLQDCDYLINYDIHWNPVRIVQRFGRIDRLGSTNEQIQLVNFWPNIELDEYINLEARVTGRMALMDVSATGEENVIEGKSDNMNDLEYRRKQLFQLQDEVIDLEEMSGGLSITDLTLNDFKMDLVSYMEENKELIEQTPAGLHALAKINSNEIDGIDPGIIFCLRQIKGEKDIKEQSALEPYFLVYITEDRRIEFSHVKSKQILDLYRHLSLGKNHVYDNLVDVFKDETDDYEDMEKYQAMLTSAINFIVGKNEEMGMASLFSIGESSLSNDSFQEADDFELITYLVVK
ncbi:helicase-related protein [Halobacillus sp. Marseille-P3879]|uniref:helicase-related protein n=1 Tax=Halobacillus sp. Marseille-P3879 TaxID=2045014 RepID=UPI000C7A9CD6|nr:helicase-related protein [Halobacillus sp. Marseille-P3879]